MIQIKDKVFILGLHSSKLFSFFEILNYVSFKQMVKRKSVPEGL